jgi:hypothetical protein
MLKRTRLSLFYLGSYLVIIGFGLLFTPHATLKALQSTRDYGDIFPRVTGMFMSGLGLSVFGMIRARSHELYPATLFIRVYFIACFAGFYAMSDDPLSMAETNCAKWRQESVPARLRQKGFEARFVFMLFCCFIFWSRCLLRLLFSDFGFASERIAAVPSCCPRAGSFRHSFPGYGRDG